MHYLCLSTASLLVFGLLVVPPDIARAQDPDPTESPETEGTNYHGEPLELPYADSPFRAEAVNFPETEDVGAPEYWTISPTGFIRVGYDWELGGDQNGFELTNARAGVEGIHEPSGISFTLTLDAAARLDRTGEDAATDVTVALKDAWLGFYPNEFLGMQIGQFRAPLTGEGLRSRSELMFIHRAIGEYGVPIDPAVKSDDIGVGRQIGAMIAAPHTMKFGNFGFHYAVMVANGNGENRIQNDNNLPAIFGRIELSYSEWLTVGAGVTWNPRTTTYGDDSIDETDLAGAADVHVYWNGLEVYGQFIHLRTDFDEPGFGSRSQIAAHAQAGYELVRKEVGVMPAYRFVYREPVVESDTPGLEPLEVMQHTVSLRMRKEIDPIELLGFVEYTRTVGQSDDAYDSDALRVLLQLAY